MKKLILLALCAGCTFGVGESAPVELVDQGGIRVRPDTITLEDGILPATVEELQFTNTADWFSGEAPHLLLRFEYEQHEIEFESVQMERLTLSGGQALLRVDGAPQIVSVSSDVAGQDFATYEQRDVHLTFAFQASGHTVQSTLAVGADFHCPPFDRTPADVDGIATIE